MTTDEGARPARYVGARMLRVEDPRLLTGAAEFVDDVRRPGLLHAVFVRSPFPHARVGAIDTSAAEAFDGVRAVLTGHDLHEVPSIATTILTRPEAKLVHRPLLVTDKARFQGDPVALVIARDRYVAEDAAELVSVDWEPLEPVVDAEGALAPDAPLLHEELGDNNFEHVEFEAGDVARAFTEAAHVFRKRFHFGRTHAAPLEGRSMIAEWDQSGRLTVWSSGQMPFLTRWMLAGLLGVRESDVRVLTPHVGGGFGLKVHLYPEEVAITLAARRLGAPVKWVEDRYEALAASGHSKEVIVDLEAAVAADGRFLAFTGRYVGDGGAYQGHPWSSLIDPLCAAVLLPSFYRLDAVRYEVDAPMTNKCQSVAYRGVGWTSGHTAREALIDDIARALETDPLELRIHNAIPDGEPFTTLTDCHYDGGSYSESMRVAAAAVGYEAFREEQTQRREHGSYIGVGFSPFVEQGGWAAEIARAMGFPGYHYTDAVTVTMESDGTVTVASGFQSNGQGHETTMAQLAADSLGIRFEDVRVVQGDTAATAYATGSWGSRTAVIASGALLLAAEDVRAKLLAVASDLLESSPDDLELYDGVVSVKGAPFHSRTIAEVAAAAYWGPRPEGVDPIPSATRSYDPPETYSNACIAAVVEVDPETGLVDVQRLVCVEDCGTVLNPMIVDGQLAGAVAQGVGAVLYEGLPYSDDGQFQAATLADFLYPTAGDVPTPEIHHLETPSPVTAGGFKGMGEGGLIGAPAAIVNAIADALAPFGASVERTPLRPEDVLGLIDGARSG
jgi:carbon-monoxide dehydrogenase large subunit